MMVSVTPLATCVVLFVVSCSCVFGAHIKPTRRDRPLETPFSLSERFPEIFLGDHHVNNPESQAALRQRLDNVLDTVEAHYNGLLHRVHELHEPAVASILQDLLLLPSGSTSRCSLAAVTECTDAEAGSVAANGRTLTAASLAVTGNSSGARQSHEKPYPTPKPLSSRLSDVPSAFSLSEWSQKVGTRLAQLPSGMSFPVLRRLLTAAVVRAWLDGTGKRLTDLEEEAVSGLFVQLYMLHKRGITSRGMMDYQHVSKSGGTSWCHAAQLNGCTTERFDKYYVCGVSSFEDKVRWVDGAAHKKLTSGEPTRWALHGTYRSAAAPDCASRAAAMQANHWTYYSNEYTLTGGQSSMSDVEVCSKYLVTAILFRNPERRLISHMRFLLLHYKRFMTSQIEEGGKGKNFFATYAGANATFWSKVAPAVTDNYFTRTLLGEAVWHAKVGDITLEHHLPAAQLVLMQFDIVVPLESPDTLTSWLLAFGAGWAVSYTDVHDKNITVLQEKFDFDPNPYMPSPAELDTLIQRQEVDMQLYDMAVLIGQLDYLVYSTAAAAGVVPWEGMPASPDLADDNARYRLACGLLRGPGGAWSSHLVHRHRKGGGQGRGLGRRGAGRGAGGTAADGVL